MPLAPSTQTVPSGAARFDGEKYASDQPYKHPNLQKWLKDRQFPEMNHY
jgi:hypothetical protein